MITLITSALAQQLSGFAAASGSCTEANFFGLRTWYHYLDKQSVTDTATGITECSIKNFHVLGGSSGSDLLLIGLAIVDDLLRIAALVAIGYVIYGAVLYMTSQGSPENTAKAQSAIVNALVGLVIAVVAVGFVAFLGERLTA